MRLIKFASEGKPHQITDAELDVLDEKVANDDALYSELISLRGGCSCHISSPCSTCCTPLTVEEAIDLGIYDDPLLALWVTAFEAFQSASSATKIGNLPGGGFDRAVRMWDDFEKIIGYLKVNAHLSSSESKKEN
jgi:hypothetical protein